jgi:hypothetical protein
MDSSNLQLQLHLSADITGSNGVMPSPPTTENDRENNANQDDDSFQHNESEQHEEVCFYVQGISIYNFNFIYK